MTVKEKNFISAVVYVRNNDTQISTFLKMLHEVLEENFEKYEIICVNDASTDSGPVSIRAFAENLSANCTLRILNMSYFQGLELSMHAGVDLAIGDFVFEFDSTIIDYSQELIMQVYNRSLEGYDIVSCGKANSRALSKLFYSVYNRHSDAQYKLKSETFRIISRRAVNRIYSMSQNIPYRKALYSSCGLKADHIQYQSMAGQINRKYILKNPIDTAFTALILFTDVAYKTTLLFTFIMMLITLGSSAYVVVVYLLGNPVPGYTTTMFLISGLFFALFAVMACIIKYLSVILGIVFNRQRYMIESIEKVTK